MGDSEIAFPITALAPAKREKDKRQTTTDTYSMQDTETTVPTLPIIYIDHDRARCFRKEEKNGRKGVAQTQRTIVTRYQCLVCSAHHDFCHSARSGRDMIIHRRSYH